jgi:hypothetical protein
MLAVEDDRLRRCSKSSCCDDAKKAMQKVRVLSIMWLAKAERLSVRRVGEHIARKRGDRVQTSIT